MLLRQHLVVRRCCVHVCNAHVQTSVSHEFVLLCVALFFLRIGPKIPPKQPITVALMYVNWRNVLQTNG